MADWFALSSRFYKDLDDMGVSEAAQTCLTRILGYIAEAEQMDGFIADSALKKLGLRSVSRRVDELVRERILTRSEQPSGHYVRQFEKWQGPLIAHVRKKNADRERAAQKRQEAKTSRDDRAKVATHITEQKRTTTYVESTPHVPDASEPEQPRGPAVPIDAWTLVRAEIPREHSQATKTALALEVAAMLRAGTPEDQVRETLRLWLAKPNLGPKTLPHLLSDVLRSRAPTTPGVGAATTKAQGWLDIANNAAALTQQQKALE